MNVVMLYASPHERGSCALLADAFVAALPSGTNIERFDAYAMNVRPCDDCGACAAGGRCTHRDMDGLCEALLACDVLVICSPVYHLSFPAPLKAVFDRTQFLFAAERREDNPFAGRERKAVLLLSAGAPSERGEVITRQLRWILQPLHARLCAAVVAAGTDTTPVGEEVLRKASQAARELSDG